MLDFKSFGYDRLADWTEKALEDGRYADVLYVFLECPSSSDPSLSEEQRAAVERIVDAKRVASSRMRRRMEIFPANFELRNVVDLAMQSAECADGSVNLKEASRRVAGMIYDDPEWRAEAAALVVALEREPAASTLRETFRDKAGESLTDFVARIRPKRKQLRE